MTVTASPRQARAPTATDPHARASLLSAQASGIGDPSGAEAWEFVHGEVALE